MGIRGQRSDVRRQETVGRLVHEKIRELVKQMKWLPLTVYCLRLFDLKDFNDFNDFNRSLLIPGFRTVASRLPE